MSRRRGIGKPLSLLRIRIRGALLGLVSLLLLKNRPTHGYQLTQEVSNVTGGIISVKQGTLYPILHDMEILGLITSEWQPSSKGPPRRVYELTRLGDQFLSEAAQTYNGLFERLRSLFQSRYPKRGKRRD